MKLFMKLFLAMLSIIVFTFPSISQAALKPSPDEVIQMLKEGNRRFYRGNTIHPHSDSKRLYRAGTENQGNHAYATVITCSDSRVPVERLFDAGVMDIFVIRVAGNVVDTDEAGSIEYGLAHVNTPVLVVLGHTQCGAVTAVTHSIQGKGHALERNIPPLVDNIIPAVKRAMTKNSHIHGDEIISYGITENVWQGIEDLFLNSPSTRNIVKSGKAKVVGAIYDVGSGKVNWLPDFPVSQILSRVEANPARAMNAMAESGHGDTGTPRGNFHGREHVEIKTIPVNLADNETIKILNTDWLKETGETLLADEKQGLSGTFWLMISILSVLGILGGVFIGTGSFNRMGLNLKLYTSYGGLVVLAFIIGVVSYMYISRLNGYTHLETAFLDLDMMASEMYSAQNNFLLHGIENKAYGEGQINIIKSLIKEYDDDFIEINESDYLTNEHSSMLKGLGTTVGHFEEGFERVIAAYHKIENGRDELDELGDNLSEAFEELTMHHEDALSKAEANNIEEISYQTLVVNHLMAAQIHELKLGEAAARFLLDKNADHIDTMTTEMGMLKGYLKALEEELKEDQEKVRLVKVEEAVTKLSAILKNVIHNEAIVEKDIAEMVEELHQIEDISAKMSHQAESMADAMMREANIATVMLILIVLVSGTLFSIFIARSISTPINKVIDGLHEGSEQVSSASGQVSSSSQALAEGASEQAASIEETSSSLEEISSMTKQNAENAEQADNLMVEANQVVTKANSSMTELTSSMSEISKASEETSKIIKTIDEIAFQTNLLALNAAVEAARAGEAGAGFAVVADEVRNLAMRAADAAKDTSELIEDTVKKINDGSHIVDTTNQAFGEVAESAQKVGSLVSEIFAASKEQAEGIGQVNKAVTEMDKVTQQNAANAEESASASEEMNAQANQMMRYVQDLVQLVGGSTHKTGFQDRSIQTIRGSGTGTLTAQKKRSEKELTLHSIKENKTDEVIPMDDKFEDF